jgi:HSP20 family protein
MYLSFTPFDCNSRTGFYSYRKFDSIPSYDSFLDQIFDNASYSTSRHFDLDESDDSYTLTLELPGYKQNDVDVNLEQSVLTVNAKKGESSYKQSVTLPRGVDADKIEAKLEDGILTVILPKAASAKPRKIALK